MTLSALALQARERAETLESRETSQLWPTLGGTIPHLPYRVLAIVLNELVECVELAVIGLAGFLLCARPLSQPALLAQVVNVVVPELASLVCLAISGDASLLVGSRGGPLLLSILGVELFEIQRIVELAIIGTPPFCSPRVAVDPIAFDGVVPAAKLRTAPGLVLVGHEMKVITAVSMGGLASCAAATENLLAEFTHQLLLCAGHQSGIDQCEQTAGPHSEISGAHIRMCC